MRKDFKLVILTIISTLLVAGSINVVAVTLAAKDIKFTSNDSEWQVGNVEDAIDDLYVTSKNTEGKILETGMYVFERIGLSTTSSIVTLTFENTYTAEDNVYLMVYNTEIGNGAENIFVRGMGKVVGNQKWIQITNVGNVNGLNDKVYYALVQLEK